MHIIFTVTWRSHRYPPKSAVCKVKEGVGLVSFTHAGGKGVCNVCLDIYSYVISQSESLGQQKNMEKRCRVQQKKVELKVVSSIYI